jgi:hypothetical protein
MACVPVAFWAWLFYAAARPLPRLLSRPVLVPLLFLLVLDMELGMSWFGMAKEHATFRDAAAFFTGNWGDDFGVHDVQVWHFVQLAARHAGLRAVLWLLSNVLGHYLAMWDLPSGLRLSWKRVGLAVTGLALADGALVACCSRGDALPQARDDGVALAAIGARRHGHAPVLAIRPARSCAPYKVG